MWLEIIKLLIPIFIAIFTPIIGALVFKHLKVKIDEEKLNASLIKIGALQLQTENDFLGLRGVGDRKMAEIMDVIEKKIPKKEKKFITKALSSIGVAAQYAFEKVAQPLILENLRKKIGL